MGKPDAIDYTDVRLDGNYTTKGQGMRLGEHELLLSFVNDIGAYAFAEYWEAEGRASYEGWATSNLERLQDSYP